MNENKSNISPTFSLDDFFTTQEQRDYEKKETIDEIDISLLDTFKKHPFKVLENDELRKLEDSISENGILEPIIVRPKDNGRYEIISGHRRTKASELIGLKKIPCIIKNMTDEEATIYMVDSNMHREQLLPSEKAFAYKMKLDALKHQGKRNDLTLDPVGHKLKSSQIIAEENNDSQTQVKRYIRLTELIPELLEYVDNSVLDEEPSIALRPAVELSYLKKEEQLMLLDSIQYSESTPSHAQAIRMRKLSSEGKLNSDAIDLIMEEQKSNQIPKIKLNESRIRTVLPKSISADKIEDFIIKSVEFYSRHLKNRELGR